MRNAWPSKMPHFLRPDEVIRHTHAGTHKPRRCQRHCILWVTPRGTTTTGLDATHPPAICQNLGGGVRGGSARGCGGGGGDIGGLAGGGSQGGGGLRATHHYHMHTSRGDVCLEVWGYGGMSVIIALSRLCREESLTGGPPTHYLSKPRGGRGAGGRGRIQGPGPAALPGGNLAVAEIAPHHFWLHTSASLLP